MSVNEANALWEAILENPLEPSLRLVFADALEESGDYNTALVYRESAIAIRYAHTIFQNIEIPDFFYLVVGLPGEPMLSFYLGWGQITCLTATPFQGFWNSVSKRNWRVIRWNYEERAKLSKE